jgi:membrane protease subunit HflC
MEIHYQLDPAKADAVIENHGRGEAYKQSAVLTHAREVLRDEFGRYSFLQVADPSSYSKATSVSRTTLNQRLKPSGIEVSQIVTPKPSFSDDVEKAIRDRQTAEQAVLVFAKQRERLVKEKDRKTQEVREERNAEYQSLVAQLAAEQQQALNEFVSVQRQADTYAIGRVAEAKAIHAEKTTKAAANSEAAKERARGLAAQINAVGAAGPDVLNLEIARNVFPQLENITAVPYSRSTTPLDIRSLPAATKGD